MANNHSRKYTSCLQLTDTLKDTPGASLKRLQDNSRIQLSKNPVSAHFLYNKNNNNAVPYTCVSVINLSVHTLTSAQHSVLSKGLKFCPTPGSTDMASTRLELDTFHRSLKLWCFFNTKEAQTDPNPRFHSRSLSHIPATPPGNTEPFSHRKFTNKSTWTPTGPITLETMIAINEIHLSYIEAVKPTKSNLTPNERLALTELQHLRDVVIKPADKGAAVVLMNTTDYMSEAHRQLSDTNYYTKVSSDLTTTHLTQVLKVVRDMHTKQEIDDKCHKYLSVFQVRTARFYMLPKIHKNIRPPPGRPIISALNCPTERISQFVDHFLKPLVCSRKSHITNTTDFVTETGN